MANLFVRNFPFESSETDIADVFASRGFPTEKVFLVTDKDTGKKKGYGFVTLSDQSQNGEAIKKVNGAPIRGERGQREIEVRLANPKPSH